MSRLDRLKAAADYLYGGFGKVNSKAAGLVTVHQADLKWLLERHNKGEALENAAALLVAELEDLEVETPALRDVRRLVDNALEGRRMRRQSESTKA